MMNKKTENGFILGLDVSTKCIGIALFEDLGDRGELKLLHHVTPKVKPVPKSKIEELFNKASIFEKEFLNKYADVGITKVIIEEPLIRSNNVYTVATLLRFNGIISRAVYDTLGVVPDFISSYDARAFAFPEFMQKRTHKRDGTPLSEKVVKNSKPVLFGALPFDVDKKAVVWDKVSESHPEIEWLYTKVNSLKKENYDMTDAFVAVRGQMHREGLWK
jgi:hypothetical protein